MCRRNLPCPERRRYSAGVEGYSRGVGERLSVMDGSPTPGQYPSTPHEYVLRSGQGFYMFTGIVEKTVRVIGVANGPKFRRLTLHNTWTDVRNGESIAINGVCLTVADIMPGELGFDVIAETLDKTNLGLLNGGDSVNVERSLRVGDRLDGHFVQGHVDGVAKLLDVKDDGDEWRLTLESPHHLAKYLVPKGSVAIDGISLTIAALRQ